MRLRARFLSISVAMLFVSWCAPALAQYPPEVETVPAGSHGPVAANINVLCIPNPNTAAASPTCPVLKLNGFTYWAYSYNDNRMDMAIVAHDPSGKTVKQWDREGAHYIWKIDVNPANETVAFVGQSGNTITMTWRELATASQPGALAMVNISTSTVHCLFHINCTGSFTDTASDIPLPSGVSGTGRIQTRTFTGAYGVAAGKTAYEYRVDMSQAVSDGEVPCVIDLAVDTGPVTKLNYNSLGPLADVFVLGEGEASKIGLFGAIKTGNVTIFTFDRPVCAGTTAGTGQSSLSFGFASDHAPKAMTAKVGWPATLGIDAGSRAPAY